jgi:hypothetical protein
MMTDRLVEAYLNLKWRESAATKCRPGARRTAAILRCADMAAEIAEIELELDDAVATAGRLQCS